MKVSILLCAHNSDSQFTTRVLESCFSQTIDPAESEVVMVDSGSSPPLQLTAPFSSKVRLLREERSGLALARAAGIRQAVGEVVVFVDDDTVLTRDYVERALHILKQRPYLAAIGGQLVPEFEGALPLPERYYRQRLAIREFRGAHWSNRWDDFGTSPIGGGMVVRREVANEWAAKFELTSWRQELGRKGNSTSGGEDFDLLHTACEMGFGKGIFEELKLTHIIPIERLDPEFLVKIAEGNARSNTFLRAMLNPSIQRPRRTWLHRLNVCVQAYRKSRWDRELILAEERGTRQGWALVAKERS